MITIFFPDGEATNWKIGDDSPFKTIEEWWDLQGIAADKEELSLIQNVFENLPYHATEEPQIWTGDHARFILANLISIPSNRDENCTALHALDSHGSEILVWSKDQRLKETDLNLIFDTCWVKCHFNEISWLLASYKNIPYHKSNSIQIWAGDMARFIVAQLPARDGQQ